MGAAAGKALWRRWLPLSSGRSATTPKSWSPVKVGTVIVIASYKRQAQLILGFASRKLKAVRSSQGKLRSRVQLNSGHDLVGHLRHAEINIQG